MPEMPPPPPRRPEGQPAIESSIFDQETPVRQHVAAEDAGSFYPDVADAGSNPFMASEAEPSNASNPFLAAPVAAAPTPPTPASAPRNVAREVKAPRVIPPAVGAPLIARPGAQAPDIRDAHAEFRQGGWQRPLVLVLIAGAVVFGMTLLPSEEKAAPTPVQLSKAPPPAVIGRSLPPGRTSDEDVREAEVQQMRGKPEDKGEPATRPSDIPAEGEFADAFKASAK